MAKCPSLPPLFEGPFPTPSQAVPAVSWVLETSTDPRTIAAAAEIVVDLQWPGGMDAKAHLSKLRDGILSSCAVTSFTSDSFTIWSVRDWMFTDAMRFGRAYCTLHCVLMSGDPPEKWQEYWCFQSYCDNASGDKELKNVIQLVAGSADLSSILAQDAKATQWALNVISSQSWVNPCNLNNFVGDFLLMEPAQLEEAALADYLFTLAVVLSSPSNRGLAWIDKSSFLEELLEHLMSGLLSKIQSSEVSMETAASLVTMTGQIALRSHLWEYRSHPYCCRIIYQFCHTLPHREGWVGVVLATGLLTAELDDFYNSDPQAAGWVYEVLDRIDDQGSDWDDRTTNGVPGILAALLYSGAPAQPNHIHIILRALSFPGNASKSAAVLLMGDHQFTWFQDEQLQPILRGASVWSSIMCIALDIGHTEACILAGSKLVRMTSWRPHILAEVTAWITIFFRTSPLVKPYNSVLERICQTGYSFLNDHERASGLSYQVLCSFWTDFELTTPEHIQASVPWLRCTGLAVGNNYFFLSGAPTITSNFKHTFCVPLQDTLLRNAKNVRDMLRKNGQPDGLDFSQTQTWKKVLDEIAGFLEDIGLCSVGILWMSARINTRTALHVYLP
ncbi:hypothetical protein C8R47DRAFT_595471 [Mycena vitilis]|nr:hypothetical protein C8R47DRAFT_595471 [Mycena vitilis]